MSDFTPLRPRMLSISRHRFHVVASEYNAEFTDALVQNFQNEMLALAPKSVIHVTKVPGAFEIPHAIQEAAYLEQADVLIALGVIIQGETAHADLIGRCVTNALQEIALRFRTPVIHEVLLVKDEAQARARTLGKKPNRGTEAARAAVHAASVMASLRSN